MFIENVLSSDGHVESTLATAAGPRRVYFRTGDCALTQSADPFLPLALLEAMHSGQPLRCAPRVAAGLTHGLVLAQDVLRSFFPQLQRVPVEATERSAIHDGGGQDVGCFFSGGVDSFYTLLKHRADITTIILVHGFDFALEETALRARASAAARKVAASLNVRLIEVETNARQFSDEVGPWGNMCHGAALASVAHALTPQLKRVYIASSYTYAQLFPWGSHPLLDPRWSSSALDVVHDGCEASRVEKVRAIAQHEIALKNLRVCRRTSPDIYNCGKCEKCVRTMVNLAVVSALDRCATLPPLDLARVSRLPTLNHGGRTFLEENYQAAVAGGADAALTDALRRALSGRYERGVWRLLRSALSAAWPDHPRLAAVVDELLLGRINGAVELLAATAFSKFRRRTGAHDHG